MPFDIQLRHNSSYREGANTPRYFVELDLSSVLPRPVRSEVAIFFRPNPTPHPFLKELYWAEVAGIRLEKGNLPALLKALPEALQGMVSFGTFPYYYLSWPGGERVAVYHSEGRLRAKLNGGTVSGDDIGEVWAKAGDSLLSSRKISHREDLEVSLLLWKDLNLYPTALIFRGGKVWLPIFYPSTQGGQEIIYDAIGLPTRFLPVAEFFQLRREVAGPLIAARALSSPFDLGVEGLVEIVWEKMKAGASPTGLTLSYPQEGDRGEMPVFQQGGEFFALLAESKHRLFFAPTPEELVRRAAVELSRQGKLPSATMLSLSQTPGR